MGWIRNNASACSHLQTLTETPGGQSKLGTWVRSVWFSNNFVFLGHFLVCNSAANQGPEWLVVVLFRRVDDGNVELRRFSAELGGDVDAGGAAADNQYGIVRFIHSGRSVAFFNRA
jgi:hypothetical protein